MLEWDMEEEVAESMGISLSTGDGIVAGYLFAIEQRRTRRGKEEKRREMGENLDFIDAGSLNFFLAPEPIFTSGNKKTQTIWNHQNLFVLSISRDTLQTGLPPGWNLLTFYFS